MRSADERASALALVARGWSDRAIARHLGIPCRTINGWRHEPERRSRVSVVQPDWRPLDASQYAFLLGMYLGDGHIAVPRRWPFLRVSMDGAYPLLIEELRSALQALFPPRSALLLNYSPGRGVIVQLSHPALLAAFPQHGPGKKHERAIELEPWQQEITAAHPRELVRGLLHSDGCRTVNRFRTRLPSGRVATYEYPRYFFTNLSADIRDLFCEHCELLGLHWTQSNPRNISISRRDSVALLDEFVGPKR